jgi:hypothetical protein
MPTIAITDLPASTALDRAAMSAIKGGGAPWVYGWITPYSRARSGLGPVVNFFQVNNTFFADQVINQFQVVDVRNSGPNSNVNVTVDEQGTNFGIAGPGTGNTLGG